MVSVSRSDWTCDPHPARQAAGCRAALSQGGGTNAQSIYRFTERRYSQTKLLFFLLLIRVDVLGVDDVIRLSAGRRAGAVTGWTSLAAAGLRA